MSRKLLFALYAAALLLALTTAYPLRHENRRDLSTFDQAIYDRALGGLDFVEDDLERRASRKSRAAARKAKGITVNPKTGKKPGVALPKGVKGAAAKKHIDDARAAKHAVKNGPGPSIYANTKKGAKDARAKEQRKDAKEIHALKAKGRTPKGAKQIANEKAEHKLHLANAKTEYAKSLASGTFPHRDAKFTTPKGNTYTGKDVHQAAFTAHLSAQKPVGFRLSDGSTSKTKDRHPKEFENRLQGPAHAQTKPLPDISSTGTKYREYGILHNKKKGYDGRSPNPTEARLITKPNAHGVHEFVGVVAHPDSTGPDMNDHHLVHPSH